MFKQTLCLHFEVLYVIFKTRGAFYNMIDMITHEFECFEGLQIRRSVQLIRMQHFIHNTNEREKFKNVP